MARTIRYRMAPAELDAWIEVRNGIAALKAIAYQDWQNAEHGTTAEVFANGRYLALGKAHQAVNTRIRQEQERQQQPAPAVHPFTTLQTQNDDGLPF